MYDAIIVGARCAGAATAMLLAQRGHRVLLVDRATFPSDTLSTHYLKAPAVERLQRWGLLEPILASNCPLVNDVHFDVGPFALHGRPPRPDIPGDVAPRRRILDKILVDAAVAAGAELREGFTVTDLIEDGGRVVGIRGRTRTWGSISERSRMVIGADGLRSRVAALVGAELQHEKPSLTCSFYSYWSGVSLRQLEMYPRDGRTLLAFPTNDDLTCVFVQWPHREFDAFRSNVERSFLDTVRLAPALAERVLAGRREERIMGTAYLPNFFRKAHGPGWALVGDAGYHRDPIFAQGITDALRDAEALAEAIAAQFRSSDSSDAPLAAYDSQRSAQLPYYEFMCQMARLEPMPPMFVRLLDALREDPVGLRDFFGVLENTVSVADFFHPANVTRIVGGFSKAPRNQIESHA